MKDVSHPKLFSVKETAKLLGLHPQTLYEKIGEGKIGYVQIGRRKKIPEQEIFSYVSRNFVPRRKENVHPAHLIQSFKEFNKLYEKLRKKNLKQEVVKMQGSSTMSTKKFHRRNYGALGKICPRQMNNGVWRFDLKWMDENGKENHKICKHAVDEIDAWKELMRINEQVKMRRENPEKAEEMSKKRITGKELVEKCRESYFSNIKNGKAHEYTADKYFVPFFGNDYLDELTGENTGRFITWIKKNSSRVDEVKEQTYTYYITIFRAMFYRAEEWGYKVPKKNPFSGKVAKLPKVVRRRVLNDNLEEEQRLMKEARGILPHIIQCSLLTAMRKKEVMKLREEDVDLFERKIHLEWDRNKVKRNREVPICDDMYKLFLLLKSQNGHSPYWFPKPNSTEPYKDIVDAWNGACKRAGIEGLNFHDLRRTAATRLLKRGANIVEIQQILGHENIETTMHYLGVKFGDTQRAIQLLNRGPREKTENIQKTGESLHVESAPVFIHPTEVHAS